MDNIIQIEDYLKKLDEKSLLMLYKKSLYDCDNELGIVIAKRLLDRVAANKVS